MIVHFNAYGLLTNALPIISFYDYTHSYLKLYLKDKDTCDVPKDKAIYFVHKSYKYVSVFL